jgi:hypothetical protein
MHCGPHPGPRQPQYSSLAGLTSGKSHNLEGFWPGATTGYWAFVEPHKIGIARTLACFVASSIAIRGEDNGEEIGQLMGFLESTLLPLTGERRPSAHSMLRFPAILKNTPVPPEG